MSPRKTLVAGIEPNRKDDILIAAERLFAERGNHGVSIRDIADAAGVQLALVGYYYGPKQALYQEIFRQRSAYVEERLRRLGEAAEGSKRDRLERIVNAFVMPALAAAADPLRAPFLRLLARGINDPLPEDEAPIRELFDPLAHAFIEALAAGVPGCSRAQAAWCYQFGLGALMHHIVDRRVERLSLGECTAGDFKTTGPMLVRFIASGMRGACQLLAQPRPGAG